MSVIIQVEILSFVYQWFHKLTPSFFADYFKPISSLHPYLILYTRQSNMITCSYIQYGLRSHCFSGAKLCSSLPLDVKWITPVSRFRRNVKSSMIDRYNKETRRFGNNPFVSQGSFPKRLVSFYIRNISTFWTQLSSHSNSKCYTA